ncbi:unnamed protein product [Euphydryas editha]|uniref:G-patch domain-containing protein n=1 Tax=Euphydryas editha TaxID=104508 RepID=A0AAU9TDD7_EUPED|nr:unnamed protein product [Euphydryas editha]
MIIKLPEMPLRNVEYLRDLISERKNDISLKLESLYESLWDAVKTYSIKYKFEVSVVKSEDGHTGNLIIEKVSNGTEQEKDKLIEGTNTENVHSSINSETDDDRCKFLKVLPFYEIIDNSINTDLESKTNGSDNSSIDLFNNKKIVLEDTEEENTETVNRDNSSDFNDQQSSDENGNRSCKSAEETNKCTSEFSTDCSENKIPLRNRVIFEKSDDHLNKTEPLKNSVMFENCDDHLDKTEVPNYIIEGIIDTKVMEKKTPWDSKLLQALSEPLESEKGLRIMKSMGWSGGALGTRGDGITEPILPALDLVCSTILTILLHQYLSMIQHGDWDDITLPGAGLGLVPEDVRQRPNTDLCVCVLEEIFDMIENDVSSLVISINGGITKKEISDLMSILESFNDRFYVDVVFSNCFESNLIKKILDKMLIEQNVFFELTLSHDNK